MADLPQSMDELNAAAAAGMRIEGYGLEVAQIMPCPFCAAPDCLKLIPYEMAKLGDADYAVTGTCKRCERTVEVRVEHVPGGTQGGFVQVGGDPQPEWLSPTMPVGEPTPGALSW
jgi:hypothetical protein